MAQKTKDQVADEARMAEDEIMADLETIDKQKLDPSDPTNFNCVAGQQLPEGFVNPEKGERGHLCVDREGLYQPKWTQLYLERVHDRQQDPQSFPLGARYLVPLEEWVDAPPEILESLNSATETHHEFNAKPGDVLLGIPTEHKTIERRRFHWREIPSA